MAKTKKKPAPKKADGLTTQANLEAFVRYGGQLGELARMARDTKADAEVRARDSVAAGDAIAQSARRAQPELQRIYDSSLGEMAKRKGIMESQLSGLGSAANPYKAGGLFASTNAENRTSGEKASALRELVGRQQDAVSGARFGAQQARAQGDSDVEKIRQKILDVQAESGAYQAGRIGDLKDAQRQRALTKRGQDKSAASSAASRAQSERNSIRSSGVDPDTGKPIKGGKLDKKSKSLAATPEQSTSLQSAIAKAKRFAASQKQAGRSRSEAASTLVQGRNAQSVLDRDAYRRLVAGETVNGESAKGADGKVDKTLARNIATVQVPAVPAFDELAASVALDLVYDGHVSRKNVARLHGPGGGKNPRYKARDLGLNTKPAPRKTGGTIKTTGKSLFG